MSEREAPKESEKKEASSRTENRSYLLSTRYSPPVARAGLPKIPVKNLMAYIEG